MSTESQSEQTVSSAMSTVSDTLSSHAYVVKDAEVDKLLWGLGITVAVFAIKKFYEIGASFFLYRKRNDEAMLMFMIELGFLDENMSEITSREEIAGMFNMLKTAESTPDVKARCFVCMTPETGAFDRVLLNCHWLKPIEISKLYELIEDLRAYYSYYESLGSENFKELSMDRKRNTLEQLYLLGTTAMKNREKFLQLDSIRRFYLRTHMGRIDKAKYYFWRVISLGMWNIKLP
ncbi:hypothetical protein [Vibrio breoganii]|uniref:hypothetical protein n=1 Tax=Vibrio breoganii TaxID=553239 RepID=UPI001055E194|nr:hypothetical protein [Vibrio breoganii]